MSNAILAKIEKFILRCHPRPEINIRIFRVIRKTKNGQKFGYVTTFKGFGGYHRIHPKTELRDIIGLGRTLEESCWDAEKKCRTFEPINPQNCDVCWPECPHQQQCDKIPNSKKSQLNSSASIKRERMLSTDTRRTDTQLRQNKLAVAHKPF